MTQIRKAWLSGIASYVLWGSLPLFWALLKNEPAITVLANRIVWGAISLAPLIWLLESRNSIKLLPKMSELKYYLYSAIFLSINWGTYIWAINNNYVLACSLGYFTAPLLYFLVAKFVFNENLDFYKITALLFSILAIINLAISANLGTIVVALALSVSMVIYGIFHKKYNMPAVRSVYMEAVLLTPFALIYLVNQNGISVFTGNPSPYQILLLTLSGVVTVIPLLLFSSAVKLLPMYSIGVLQYISPVLQFILGIYFFKEAFDSTKFISFLLVWFGICVSLLPLFKRKLQYQ